MKTLKELQDMIGRAAKAEAEENRVRHEERRAELRPAVDAVREAIQALGFVDLGGWNNDDPKTAGDRLSYTAKVPALPEVGRLVSVTVAKSATNSRMTTVTVVRDDERNTEVTYTCSKSSGLETDKFQLYLLLAVTERFPNTRFGAVMYDRSGNLREKAGG